jgi:hypothetical protein
MFFFRLQMAVEVPRCARDFACGLTLGVASLTPAKRLSAMRAALLMVV